jgi:hypothetical protein
MADIGRTHRHVRDVSFGAITFGDLELDVLVVECLKCERSKLDRMWGNRPNRRMMSAWCWVARMERSAIRRR